jgi:MoxR-like ATPase
MENEVEVSEKNNRDRIERLLKFLNSGLSEREEAVRLALLSALAGESIFFLGPPGTAKSMISRRVKEVFKDETTYFEYLLNEFSTPDEICGPVSLKGLENDEYKRITKGYLSKANIAFLDEIWKAGPAILNTLLSIINERKFHNGSDVQDVPLISLVTASNELPPEKRGLEALWDRLVLRVPVNCVNDENNFFKAITGTTKELKANESMKKNLITLDELKTWQEKIDDVLIPEPVRNIITAIRKELTVKNNEADRGEKEKYYVSDRRWKKIIRILRTSAFFNDRTEVDLMDCQLIQYCIWNTEEQQKESNQIVEKIAQDYGFECNTAIDDVHDQIEAMQDIVYATWYRGQPGEPIKENDTEGESYYKVHDSDGNLFYISEEEIRKRHISYNYDYYYKFDNNWENGEYCDSMAFDDITNRIEFDGEIFTVECTASSLVKKEDIFNDVVIYSAAKGTFDQKYYTPISETIKEELEKLEQDRSQCEKPFLSNLFAEKNFAESLFSKMEDAKKELENAKVKLDQVQARYEK